MGWKVEVYIERNFLTRTKIVKEAFFFQARWLSTPFELLGFREDAIMYRN